MSKLKMVQSLPSGGATPTPPLGGVGELLKEVQKTNAVLGPLMALPELVNDQAEELKRLVKQDTKLHEATWKVLKQFQTFGKELQSDRETLGESLAVERGQLKSERGNLEEEVTCLRAIEASMRKSAVQLRTQRRLAEKRALWHVVVVAIVAAIVVLNVEPAVAWLWKSEDAAQAQAWRALVTRASEAERKAFTQIRHRQQDKGGNWK